MLLIFKSGPREGRSVDINRGRVTIGRVAENDLQLFDEKVSRHHAVIEVQEGQRVVLRDLGSRNGTFVDGHRLAGSCLLTGGEQLRFGEQELRVEGAPEARAPAEAPSPEPTPAEAPARHQVPGGEPQGPSGRSPGALMRRRRVVVAVAIAAVVLVVLGVGQLVLPGVAENRLRSQLARYGAVRQVQIESVPAVKLLWHRADSLKVAMDSYRSQPSGHGSLADFLSRTRDVGKLEVSVATLQSKLVTLHQAHLRKEGNQLVGEAEITQQELSAALPSYLNLRPVSATANGIVLQASASVLGHRITLHLGVLADAGRVIVRPEGLLLASLATITVFSDPRIYVESVGGELRGERYLLTARARLL
jgi:hypothetical protein